VPAQKPTILATLFGEGYGLYEIQKGTFLLSPLAHVLAIGLLLASSRYLVLDRHHASHAIMQVVTDVNPYFSPPSTANAAGGGGGDRDKLAASEGRLLQFSRQQFVPAAVVIRNENPELPVAPVRLFARNPFAIASAGQSQILCHPSSHPPSNGIGTGGEIGSGSGGVNRVPDQCGTRSSGRCL
jgi:hypothetical protein